MPVAARGLGVGAILRRAREERGITLEQARAEAGVPLHYLQAMEEGRSRMVADEAYVIPWLRRYADFLDLDPSRVVARFLAEAERTEAVVPPVAPLPPEPPTRRMAPWGVALVLAALVALVAWTWLSRSAERRPLPVADRPSAERAERAEP